MTLKTASQTLDPSVNRAALDGQNPAVKLQTLPNGLNSPLQNETALAFLTTRTANSKANVGNVGDNPNAKPDKILYHVFVKVPEGQKQATYEQLNRAVIKAVFNKNGIQLSRAALEEVSARLRLDYTPRYNYATGIYETNKKDGVMADVHDKEKGQYEFKISERVENLILGEAKLAQEVTASGKKAFSEIRMDERLQMLMERTGKHLPKDAAEALKLIDPKALIAGMAIGAGVGSLVKRGLIASSAVILVGGAMTTAQLLNYMGKAEHVLDTVQRAKTPQDLDAPAKELAELVESGGMDLLLAAAGFGAGRLAPRAAKAATQVTEQVGKYADDAARIVKQGQAKGEKIIADYNEQLQKLAGSMIPETRLSPANGAPFGVSPKGKTPLEKIHDPKKIVSVDSNGNASGTRFRDDYQTHIKEREFSKASQRDGVNGAHNLKEFEQYDININPTLTKDSLNIISKIPHPTVRGIYKIEYKMPVLDRTGTPVAGQWRNRNFPKTVYDPAIISDKQIAEWGRQAFANAIQNNTVQANGKWRGQAPNGLMFEGYVDQRSKSVRTFYPKF